jgi:hypothetical protein
MVINRARPKYEIKGTFRRLRMVRTTTTSREVLSHAPYISYSAQSSPWFVLPPSPDSSRDSPLASSSSDPESRVSYSVAVTLQSCSVYLDKCPTRLDFPLSVLKPTETATGWSGRHKGLLTKYQLADKVWASFFSAAFTKHSQASRFCDPLETATLRLVRQPLVFLQTLGCPELSSHILTDHTRNFHILVHAIDFVTFFVLTAGDGWRSRIQI